MNSTVQAILFPRSRFTTSSARAWAEKNGYSPLKYHVTRRYVRARIIEPSRLAGAPMRTIDFGQGIRAVIVMSHAVYSPMPRRAPKRKGAGTTRPNARYATQRPRQRVRARAGGGYFDTHPALLENLVTTGLVAAAIAGIVAATRKK
jgi:hypothetical protein